MTILQAFWRMRNNRDMTFAKMAKKAEFAHMSTITTPMQKGNIQLSTLEKIAKAAGYKVMLVPDEVEVEDGIEIESGDGKT